MSTFEGCTSITEIKIPDSVTKIEMSTFEGCTSLTEIKIPDLVTEIEMYAFEGCTSLTKINFGTGLEKIGISAFKGCTSLTEIKLPKSFKHSITDLKGNGPFSECTNLVSVIFEEGTKIIGEGVCAGVNGITEIKIPDSVTEIEMYAFNNCKNLKKITILDNVKDIGLDSRDVVFENHNEDLTIYCYKDSYVDQYGEKYNIKREYLQRPATPTTPEDNNSNNNNSSDIGSTQNNNSNPTSSSTNNNNNPTSTSSEVTENSSSAISGKKDITLAPQILPKTGVGKCFIFIIVLISAYGIYTYFKYKDLKDIK